MKRKITELEENLTKKGWQLSHKTYVGKHSDKVENYVYTKIYEVEHERENDGKIVIYSWDGMVLLDSKRVYIEDVFIKNPFRSFVNESVITFALSKWYQIQKEVYDCYPVNQGELSQEDVNEQVQVAEAIGDSICE